MTTTSIQIPRSSGLAWHITSKKSYRERFSREAADSPCFGRRLEVVEKKQQEMEPQEAIKNLHNDH